MAVASCEGAHGARGHQPYEFPVESVLPQDAPAAPPRRCVEVAIVQNQCVRTDPGDPVPVRVALEIAELPQERAVVRVLAYEGFDGWELLVPSVRAMYVDAGLVRHDRRDPGIVTILQELSPEPIALGVVLHEQALALRYA